MGNYTHLQMKELRLGYFWWPVQCYCSGQFTCHPFPFSNTTLIFIGVNLPHLRTWDPCEAESPNGSIRSIRTIRHLSIVENWSITSSDPALAHLGSDLEQSLLFTKHKSWGEATGEKRWLQREVTQKNEDLKTASLLPSFSWKFQLWEKKALSWLKPGEPGFCGHVLIIPACLQVARWMWLRSPDSTTGMFAPAQRPLRRASSPTHLSVSAKPKGPLYYNVTLSLPTRTLFISAAAFLLV